METFILIRRSEYFMLRYILVLMMLAISGCREHDKNMNAAPIPPRGQLAEPREISAETLAFVHNYIKTTRGWLPDTYELEFLDERSGLLFIFIGYKQETKDTSRLGSDKSFYVGFDEKRMTVVQEGKLQ